MFGRPAATLTVLTLAGTVALSLMGAATALLLPGLPCRHGLQMAESSAPVRTEESVGLDSRMRMSVARIVPRRVLDCAESLGVVRLTVVREDGRGLAKTTIEVFLTDDQSPVSLLTNAEGRAEILAAEPGVTARVRISRDDFEAEEQEIDLDAGERSLVVPTRGTMSGRLTVDGEVPDEPIRITVTRVDGGRDLAALTDSEGRFELFGLPPCWDGCVSVQEGFESSTFPIAAGRPLVGPLQELPANDRIANVAVLGIPGDIDVESFLNPIGTIAKDDLRQGFTAELHEDPPPFDKPEITVVDTMHTSSAVAVVTGLYRPVVYRAVAWDLGIVDLKRTIGVR